MTVNINGLKESLNCDEVFLMHLMEKFMLESGEDTSRLKRASIESNWSQVRSIAHKMLSSTRIFNIDELSTLLEKIETTAEKNQVDQIPANVDTVEHLWKNVVLEIKQYLEKPQS
jgi:HPt (histidine-containing phosphotransfer) domain-containing protein